MNRLTLRITGGVLAAVLVSTVAVQLFIDWQVDRALAGGQLRFEPSEHETVCIGLEGLSSAEREALADELHARVGIAPESLMFDPQLPTALPKAVVTRSGAVTLPPLGWLSVSLLVAAAVAFVTAVGALLSRPVLKRLRLLEDAAERIAAGELGARALLWGRDPIAQFALRFDQMAERNQQLLEGQRHLLQAVSHELRTPATRIRFGLEMLREATSAADRERHGAAIDGALDEIDELVQELLMLNQLDFGAVSVEEAPIDAVRAVHEEYAVLAALRPEIAVELPDRGGERIFVAGSDKLVRRAIRNLVSNAIRHAQHRVRVTLERRGAYVRVFVDDDGPGVAVADRVRILEPFTRVDASRSRGSGGVGLGLAIVERIVNAHRGRLAVREAPLGGARFAMSLPVADSQQDARRAWWDR